MNWVKHIAIAMNSVNRVKRFLASALFVWSGEVLGHDSTDCTTRWTRRRRRKCATRNPKHGWIKAFAEKILLFECIDEWGLLCVRILWYCSLSKYWICHDHWNDRHDVDSRHTRLAHWECPVHYLSVDRWRWIRLCRCQRHWTDFPTNETLPMAVDSESRNWYFQRVRKVSCHCSARCCSETL